MNLYTNKQIFSNLIIFGVCTLAKAQTIGNFTSIMPAAQNSSLAIPATHTFQRLLRTGDALTQGGTVGSNLDFTGYVPIAASSTSGYLSVSSETAPAECAILNISFDGLTKLWQVTQSGKVDLPFADLGGCAAFCSGTVTPANTVMVCEEGTLAIDGNGDGYHDLGWIIEIDPATRKVINQDGTGGVDKLWAMGNQSHENVTIKADQAIAYWGADNGTYGFIYKFVPTVAGNYSSGDLYVLETTGTGSGTWKKIANTSTAERNNTISASVTAGAYNFNRVEDMEIGPDGKVYFASTGTGRVLRFTDDGATISNLETFVDNNDFSVGGSTARFEWPDNMAFDGEGNLWVLQDGGSNHIWVIGPGHTAANPQVKIFANTPAGSEPTGITFSPDYKFLFLSLQHPNGSNTTTQTDAAGQDVAFDNNTTLVIARTENLGNGSILPVQFVSLVARPGDRQVALTWATFGAAQNATFTIERSVDGTRFETIATMTSLQGSQNQFSYMDNQPPASDHIYYRVKGCDPNNHCVYSPAKMAKLIKNAGLITLYPQPVRDFVNIKFENTTALKADISIYSSEGKLVYKSMRQTVHPAGMLVIPTKNLAKGTYIITAVINGDKFSKQFIK